MIASIVLLAAIAMITPFPFASESATMFLLGGALIGAGSGMRRWRTARISENDAGVAE